jgi:hypothetical protein
MGEGESKMKALTLYEPWATLVAMGERKIETRSWATSYRGPLAIHAAASMPKWVKELCHKFAKLLKIKDYNSSWLYNLEHGTGPFGKVVATCELVACLPIRTNDELNEIAYADMGVSWHVIDGNEYHFGDYTPGRYAWMLQNIKPLPKPIPAKGMQRIWNWNDERMV